MSYSQGPNVFSRQLLLTDRLCGQQRQLDSILAMLFHADNPLVVLSFRPLSSYSMLQLFLMSVTNRQIQFRCFPPVNGSIGGALPRRCTEVSAGVTSEGILGTEVFTGGSICPGYWNQTSQLSRFCRETHGFKAILTVNC